MCSLDAQILAEFQKLKQEEKVRFILSLPDLLSAFEAVQEETSFAQCSTF